MAGNDIYLRGVPPDANPNDVRLYQSAADVLASNDPTGLVWVDEVEDDEEELGWVAQVLDLPLSPDPVAWLLSDDEDPEEEDFWQAQFIDTPPDFIGLLTADGEDEEDDSEPVLTGSFGDFPHVVGVLADLDDEEDPEEAWTAQFIDAQPVAVGDWITALTADEDEEEESETVLQGQYGDFQHVIVSLGEVDEVEDEEIEVVSPFIPTAIQAVTDLIQTAVAEAEDEQEEFDTWLAQVIAPARTVGLRSMLAPWVGGASKPQSQGEVISSLFNDDFEPEFDDETTWTGNLPPTGGSTSVRNLLAFWMGGAGAPRAADFIRPVSYEDQDQDIEADEETGWTGYTQRISTGTVGFRSLMAFWAGGGSQGPAADAVIPDWIIRARRRGIR